MIDEAERSLHDALSVLSQTVKETRIVLGGGCSEMLMSCAVEEEARKGGYGRTRSRVYGRLGSRDLLPWLEVARI